MKNRNGFIKTPILIAIIVGIIAISGLSYFGYIKFKDLQIEQSEKEKLTQENDESADKGKSETMNEIEELKKEIEELKNKESQIIIKEVPVEVPPKEDNLVSIVDYWRPRVARIICTFSEWDNERGTLTGLKNVVTLGSGLLMKLAVRIKDAPETKYSIFVMTNKHVIQTQAPLGKTDYEFTANECRVIFQDNDKVYTTISIKDGVEINDNSILVFPDDHAVIEIVDQDEYIKNHARYIPACKPNVSVGEKIVILGFPSLGSIDEITATEGIISGNEGNYYITSAKLEKGGSGGAAILVSENCYLGIPTFAAVGEIESLGRILKADTFLKIAD